MNKPGRETFYLTGLVALMVGLFAFAVLVTVFALATRPVTPVGAGNDEESTFASQTSEKIVDVRRELQGTTRMEQPPSGGGQPASR